MNVEEAKEVLRFTDWDDLLEAGEGTVFPVIIEGRPELASVVKVTDKEDSDEDRELEVVVSFNGQFFQREGYAQIGSHCYGEYTPSWYGIKEVFPRQKVITVYEEKDGTGD